MTPVAYALDVLQGNNVTAGNLLPTLVVIKRSLIEQKNGGKIKYAGRTWKGGVELEEQSN